MSDEKTSKLMTRRGECAQMWAVSKAVDTSSTAMLDGLGVMMPLVERDEAEELVEKESPKVEAK